MNQPKEYYKSYLADDKIGFIGEYLLVKMMLENPNHILEFGCGTGKHLKKLQDRGINTIGVDVSLINIIKAQVKHDLPFVVCTDENYLRNFCNIDIVFTVSVLDHIKNVSDIIGEFKRITNYSVYLAETNDIVGEHYFKHNYESYGFTKIPDFDWKGEDGAIYYIWKWEKNPPEVIEEKEIEKVIEPKKRGGKRVWNSGGN